MAVADNSKEKYLYKIGAHDQLGIIVWGHPEFSSPSGLSPVAGEKYAMAGNLGTQVNQALVPNKYSNKAFFFEATNSIYTVDENGDVYLPLCGPVLVINKTPTEVRKEVTQKLLEYVVNPQVNVNMVSYRSKFAYVVGEVSQANMIPMTDVPLDLASALSMSGWVNLATADVKNIYVLRQGAENNIKVYRLNATTPSALVFASGFALEPSDVVFVSTAGVAQFDRVMTHFLNAAETLWYTRTAINPTTNIIPGIN
jgi:polysaccharide export outer membrane protein